MPRFPVVTLFVTLPWLVSVVMQGFINSCPILFSGSARMSHMLCTLAHKNSLQNKEHLLVFTQCIYYTQC